MSLSRVPRATVVALVVATAVLGGCSDKGTDTPAGTPTSKTPAVTATTTPSASATTTPASTATATPPAATVTAAPGLHATNKEVVSAYGQKDADLAMSTAQEIGYKISISELLTGKIKGDAVLDPLGDVIDNRLIKDLQAKPALRDSVAMGNLPYKIDSHTNPTVAIGQPFPAKVDGDPVVGVVVDVRLQETTKQYGVLAHHRHLTVYLERQSDTSEGTWRMRAVKTTEDKIDLVGNKHSG